MSADPVSVAVLHKHAFHSQFCNTPATVFALHGVVYQSPLGSLGAGRVGAAGQIRQTRPLGSQKKGLPMVPPLTAPPPLCGCRGGQSWPFFLLQETAGLRVQTQGSWDVSRPLLMLPGPMGGGRPQVSCTRGSFWPRPLTIFPLDFTSETLMVKVLLPLW